MLRQKRPTEIKAIGILTLIFGLLAFFGGLGLVTSTVSLSEIGVDVSGLDAQTIDAISFGTGLYLFAITGFCATTLVCIFLRSRFAWPLTMILSAMLSILGILSFQQGLYFDGTLYFVFCSIISTLAFTDRGRWYLKRIY